MLALAALLAPLTSPFPAAALPLPVTDLFVDASATCAGADGSAAAPFCTIGEALTAAVDGDVVRVAPGTYSEAVTISKNVELIGTEGAAVTTIDRDSLGTTMFGPAVTVESPAVVTLVGLTITGGFGSGGGVQNAGTLTVRECRVEDNLSNGIDSASGIECLPGAGPLVVERTTIADNRGGSFASAAHAIRALRSESVTIRESTLRHNDGLGSTVLAFETPLVIESTTISDNAPLTSTSGVVEVVRSSAQITNCTIANNTGANGGVSGLSSQITIRSTTLTGNGGQAVGGLRCRNGSLTLTSSIIAENEGSTAPDLFLDGTTLNSTGFNLIGDASGVPGFLPSDLLGTSASPLDPLLAPLAPNGGLTETRLPLELSPALDAGDPSNTEPVDQRGEPRLAGLGDIGSVEALPVGLGDPIPGCVGAPNSTGAIGRTRTAGSLDVSSNDFALVATSLPPGQFGVFVVSRTPGFSAGAGGSSDGNLCLAGAIGRFNGPGQIVNSGTNGIASLDVDFTAIPTPTAFVTAAAGETWFFQAWHRDSGGLGSNFTEGEGVLLR